MSTSNTSRSEPRNEAFRERRRAREAALQMLYQCEVGGVEPEEADRNGRAHTIKVTVKVPGGRGAVVAEIGEDFRIRRLQVRDSRFRTARGVGVGSTYAALRHAHGTHAPGQGEGAVYVVVRDLRMSFGFSYAGRGQRRPVELPDTAKVTHILVLPPAASDPKDPHAE